MEIKSEPHTEDKKAYLTYDVHPVAKSRLLDEQKNSVYHIYLGGTIIQKTNRINAKVIQSLVDDGFEVERSTKTIYVGKTQFLTKDGNKIPVVVRKLMDKNELKQIRVRVTASTHEQLMDRTYAIRDTLAAYGLKHKLCVWDRTGNI